MHSVDQTYFVGLVMLWHKCFQRPLSSVGEAAGWNRDVIDRKLLMWYFESQLKHKYAEFVKALQVKYRNN